MRDCAESAFLQTCDTKTNKHQRVQVTEVTRASSCIRNPRYFTYTAKQFINITSYDKSVTVIMRTQSGNLPLASFKMMIVQKQLASLRSLHKLQGTPWWRVTTQESATEC